MAGERRLYLSACLVIVACALLGGWFGGPSRAATASNDADIENSLRLFTKVLSAVEANYADPVNEDKAIYNGAIPGMLRTLDPHSNFFDPKMFSLLREEQQGRYYGVGMTVGPRSGKTIVMAPFVGSPAYRAGIRPGDVIAAVDHKPTDNLSTTEVAEMLKGPKGTKVVITILREGSSQPLIFDIIRDEIPRHSVEQAFEVTPGIGYVNVVNFNETTGRELGAALRKLDTSSLHGLILDLRGNPGGLLNEGVAVADMFLQKGQVVVSHRGRSSPEKVYRANNGSRADYPLVVLMNRYSASASEIVAGAIQDHDRGLVVGENSFGKGLVQTVYPLSENTGLALTTAKYYTPSGRLIQRDFTSVSLYDYYNDRARNNPAQSSDVRNTDSGRLVYGGGGISPDVRVEIPKLGPFLTLLEIKFAFFNFAKYYLGIHNTITREFEMNDAVLSEFRNFLDREKIPFTEDALRENRETLARRVKQELFISIFGKIEGDRIQIRNDPAVLKGLEAMPKARELADNARRMLAQRMGR